MLPLPPASVCSDASAVVCITGSSAQICQPLKCIRLTAEVAATQQQLGEGAIR